MKSRMYQAVKRFEEIWRLWLQEKPQVSEIKLSRHGQNAFHVEFSMVIAGDPIQDAIRLEAAALELQMIADWVAKKGKAPSQE